MPGVQNAGADHFSRGCSAAFLENCQQASLFPSQVQEELVYLLCLQPADLPSLDWRDQFSTFWRQAYPSQPGRSTVQGGSGFCPLPVPSPYPSPHNPSFSHYFFYYLFLGSEDLAVSTILSYREALLHFRVLADPPCTFPQFYSPHTHEGAISRNPVSPDRADPISCPALHHSIRI